MPPSIWGLRTLRIVPFRIPFDVGHHPAASVLALGLYTTCKPTALSAYYKWLTVDNRSRQDAHTFCDIFSTNATNIRLFGSGKNNFGWQTALFIGNFFNTTSCLDAFNTLVTRCYGTADPSRPITLGGRILDSGGATLVVSFGSAVIL